MSEYINKLGESITNYLDNNPDIETMTITIKNRVDAWALNKVLPQRYAAYDVPSKDNVLIIDAKG